MMDNSSNALRYDVANGVGIRSTTNYSAIMTLGSYTTIERFGFMHGCSGQQLPHQSKFQWCWRLHRCSSLKPPSYGLPERHQWLSGLHWSTWPRCSLLNSVLVARNANCSAVKLLYVNSTTIVANNTIVVDQDFGTNGELAFRNMASSGFYCANNAIFGWSACSNSSVTLSRARTTPPTWAASLAAPRPL